MSKIVTVFGATGGQGGGVVSSLLKAVNRGEGDYSIRAITRNPDGQKAHDLKSNGCEIVKCDMDDQASVEEAVRGSYAVFLVTNYWEHFSAEKEIDQGKRVIDASEKLGVKHLIYSGLENVKKSMGLECAHFDSKGKVEEYLHTKKLRELMNFTIVRFSFYYNNLATLMKPRRVDDTTFVFDIPMEGVGMDGIDVTQGGECVYAILENPDCYRYKTIGLTGDKRTIEQYCDILCRHLEPLKFQDSKISVEQYKAMGFDGAEEIANMFAFYIRGRPDRDMKLTKKLNPGVQRFEMWVEENKEMLAKSFKDLEIQFP